MTTCEERLNDLVKQHRAVRTACGNPNSKRDILEGPLRCYFARKRFSINSWMYTYYHECVPEAIVKPTNATPGMPRPPYI